MSFVEQRQTKRYDVAQDVWVTRDGAESVGTTQNMSLGGLKMRIELDPPASVGQRVQIKLKIPQLEDPIRVDAEVRWCDANDPLGVGIQFVTGLRAKETWALGQYLESLPGSG